MPRKTFYLLRKNEAYKGPISLVPLLGGNVFWFFTLPFPIFDLVHLQTI